MSELVEDKRATLRGNLPKKEELMAKFDEVIVESEPVLEVNLLC